MPANRSSHSSTPSVHPGHVHDSSDEPMSPRDRARHRSDKRRAACSPSPCCYHSPSHEGCQEKHHHVTAHDDSPPAQWIATTTGLLVHNPRDQCPKCLAYQHHVSLDLILETLSIMNARNDCLMNLVCIMGWDDAAAKLHNELALVRRNRDHWHMRAEEAESASAVSEQQPTAAFEQARLLLMYIPSAHPEDTPGNASFLQGEESLGTIFGEMNIDEPSAPALSGSSLSGRLEETMFPLLRQGEVPNRVSMLLDSMKYLHVQVGKCLYQFKGSAREDILRNLRVRVPPPLAATIPPGTVRLFNTIAELDKLYALVARESEEHDSPNTKLGQRLVARLNRYLGDSSHTPEVKPRKNSVIIHTLLKWRPPAWVTSRGKNKCNGYKKAYQAAWKSTCAQCEALPLPSSSIPEGQQPAAASLFSVLEASQPPAASSSSAPAPVMTRRCTFGVMSTSRQPILPPTMPPLILTRRSCTTYLRQDGLPRGGPGWGDELDECGMAQRFLGIQNEAAPKFREPPSDQRLRGFILKGYFAPHFQYDSNLPGRYCAIVEREGWVIVPSRSSPWTVAIDRALSPLLIAEHLARNGLSFQEADDLYKWAAAALHEDATGREADASITADLVIADTTSEGPGRSLEYYEERVEQQGPQFEF
ncbi:hypothetical protein SCLCIDRAFT_20958 [Scleroderma citrinum Foug A]|uniref:Uncharacterized protein n=1 Tax=Scleroderma citrinum Foug A TaxID=1036808 RepID=A0A0C3EGL0_9AGAM|nr:hypothetical protein SCLCIDRAFT_20958 [Scleroderma citrinum Foug A]